ncbi:unnamed protein product [Effrenium voratum]|uniref:Protein kinase domain-containing protein n=1 Tax=Effrenium voratum TaxID=2562239 RepID=A0AA36NH42_9DINO|nr:unnamed protein product [Effrenium voratum]
MEEGPARVPRPRRRRLWFLVLALAVVLVLPTVRRATYLSVVWTPALLSALIWPSPTVVVNSLQLSGPVFIKLAQWLSTRRDILPNDLCDAMGTLHEHVPSTLSRQDIRHAVAEIPGLEVQDLLGGGCVAQVYSGLFEGQEVAVKVRRSGIVPRLEVDLRLLKLAAQVVMGLKPSLKWMALDKALENFSVYMMQQVDLRKEADHMRRFTENFKKRKNIQVPRIYANTESVLVMGQAPGVSLSDFIKANHSVELRTSVHYVLTDMMAKMGLQDKFLHGDLHPGNLFIDLQGPEQKPLVTLIDTGISIGMSPNISSFTKDAMTAAFRRDPQKLGWSVVTLHQKEGLAGYGEGLEDLAHDVGYLLLAGCFMVDESIWAERFKSFEDYNGTKVSEYFTMLMGDLSKHKVRVSPDLWSIMTAFALIEGSISELGFGVNVLGACIPYIMNPLNVIDWRRSWKTLHDSDENSRKAGRK